MSKSIHGHEIMRMMVESDISWNKTTLKEAIEKKFGKDARFHTCSAENLNSEEIINFLERTGKFLEKEGKFKTDKSKICSH
jgi:probable metal-binding protein